MRRMRGGIAWLGMQARILQCLVEVSAAVSDLPSNHQIEFLGQERIPCLVSYKIVVVDKRCPTPREDDLGEILAKNLDDLEQAVLEGLLHSTSSLDEPLQAMLVQIFSLFQPPQGILIKVEIQLEIRHDPETVYLMNSVEG